MLSSLPKLADKAFIIGFFIPTLLFVLAIAGLFHGHAWTKPILDIASASKDWDKLAYFALGVWVLSLLVMMFNHIEMQILEGYRWPVSKIAHLKRKEQQRYDAMNDRFLRLNAEWKNLGNAFPEDRKIEVGRLRRQLVEQFPTETRFQLPTRFGNAVRAFEVYSSQVYGADSIPLWIHLGAVIPADFQSSIADARAQVNCAVNISVFAAVISVISIVGFPFSIHWGAYSAANSPIWGLVGMLDRNSVIFLASALVAAGISRGVYLFAIELVYAWGKMVKAAVDCYLPALAKQLGYELPPTSDQRKAFWSALSQQAIYWTPMKPEQWKPPEKKATADKPTYTVNEITEILTLNTR